MSTAPLCREPASPLSARPDHPERPGTRGVG